eukprot:4216847-Amphidinium_carterae.1
MPKRGKRSAEAQLRRELRGQAAREVSGSVLDVLTRAIKKECEETEGLSHGGGSRSHSSRARPAPRSESADGGGA